MAFGPEKPCPAYAVQLVALVELQERVVEPLYEVGLGEAEMVTVGDGGRTVTNVKPHADPPAPEHRIRNDCEVTRLGTTWDPFVDFEPEKPCPAYAVQLVALVELQERVVEPLYAVGLGEALMVTVGGGGGATHCPLLQTRFPPVFPSSSTLQSIGPDQHPCNLPSRVSEREA
ncbi:MAG: hypothetical protein Q7R48_01475 [bacterium]|nr:hypothetical protein [bacterium]